MGRESQQWTGLIFTRTLITCITLATLSGCASAQPSRLHLPDYSHLARKASDSNTVNLSGTLLKLASIAAEDEASQLLASIEAVQVRNFEFADEGAYSSDDVEAVRRQLTSPRWSQVARVRERRGAEQVDVFICIDDDKTCGLAVIVAEPRELTIVNVVGSIAIEKLRALDGRFSIRTRISGS